MTTLATEDFAGTGALSANWTTVTGAGAPQRSSGRVRTNAVGTDSLAKYTALTWANNQYSSIKPITSSTTARGIGAMVRCASAAASYYVVYCTVVGASANLTLAKFTTGSSSTLATTTSAVNSGDILRLDAISSALKVYVNGTLVSALNTTDSTWTSGTPGFLVYVDVGTTPDSEGDDWEGGDFASASTISGEASVVIPKVGRIPMVGGRFSLARSWGSGGGAGVGYGNRRRRVIIGDA